METGQPIGEPMAGHTAEIHGWTFSPDGTRLATASFDGSVRLWDTVAGRAPTGAAPGPRWPGADRGLQPRRQDAGLRGHRQPDLPVGYGHGHANRTTAGRPRQLGACLLYSDDGETLFSADADGHVPALGM